MGARGRRKQQPGLPGVQAEDLCADAWMLQALAHHIAQGLPTVVPVDYDDPVTLAGRRDKNCSSFRLASALVRPCRLISTVVLRGF